MNGERRGAEGEEWREERERNGERRGEGERERNGERERRGGRGRVTVYNIFHRWNAKIFSNSLCTKVYRKRQVTTFDVKIAHRTYWHW